MRSTDHDPIGPGFEWRLRAALNRVTPPSPSRPRYQTARAGGRPLRLAPFALATAGIALLALSATAATGSPNPRVWTERATTTIESVGHAPATVPSPEPSPNKSPESQQRAPAVPSTHKPEDHASPNPQPSDHPEESPRPEPTETSGGDDHSGSGSGSGSSSTSPSPSPSPTPKPNDHDD